MGLGRMQLEHDQIAAETATRRQLTVEEQMNEDLQTTHNRLQRAEEREKTEAHVQEIKKSFFCEVRVTHIHCISTSPCTGHYYQKTLHSDQAEGAQDSVRAYHSNNSVTWYVKQESKQLAPECICAK